MKYPLKPRECWLGSAAQVPTESWFKPVCTFSIFQHFSSGHDVCSYCCQLRLKEAWPLAAWIGLLAIQLQILRTEDELNWMLAFDEVFWSQMGKSGVVCPRCWPNMDAWQKCAHDRSVMFARASHWRPIEEAPAEYKGSSWTVFQFRICQASF